MRIGNIMKVYRKVDAVDYTEGLLAYRRYHDGLQQYADKYGLPLTNVVAAFSALSPNNDYQGNLRSLVTLLDGRERGRTVDRLTVSTYRACRDRAWRFLHGEDFLAVTHGKKTRNFYANIIDPDDPTPVTIDGHMICVYVGKRMTMHDAVRLRADYDEVAAAVRKAARSIGVLPNQLQAMLWFTWKRINNVVFTPQMDLFRTGNQWGAAFDPKAIKPYDLDV